MKPKIISLLILLLTFLSSLAYAEHDENQEDEMSFTQQELDQMLAPIALYPDALLSQILMAATYPGDVAEAARWSREHPELEGEVAVKSAEREDWDPSVISLTAFPQILLQMDEKLDWTEQLGEAFLAQQEQVMDTVQHLRKQAYAAGNLQSNEHIRVLQQDRVIVIEQATPQIVYVPYYNPRVVYGSWWWDAYPPVYWDPWPGYHSGFGPGYYRGNGINVGLGFFYSNFDWHRHHLNVHPHHYGHSRYHHRRHRVTDEDRRHDNSERWRHDSSRRHNAQQGETVPQQRFSNRLPINRQDVLGPRSAPPIAAGQDPMRPRSISESVRRQEQLQNIYTPGTGTISDRAEAFKRRDNRLSQPGIQPQPRVVAPAPRTPMVAPRQIMSQPQQNRSLPSIPSGLGGRAIGGSAPGMPNNRAMQLPQ
ncbi:MAG TPA: DUF3300 domain-containing protein, partial [Methylophilaceae bacterium]|nr:DUF3300 domain-containing protein [Methylophilaceae bacterium]